MKSSTVGTFLSKMSLNVNIVKLFWHYLVSKNKFLKNLCIGGFQFLLILDLWGMDFSAVVDFIRSQEYLLKSILERYDWAYNFFEIFLNPSDS